MRIETSKGFFRSCEALSILEVGLYLLGNSIQCTQRADIKDSRKPLKPSLHVNQSCRLKKDSGFVVLFIYNCLHAKTTYQLQKYHKVVPSYSVLQCHAIWLKLYERLGSSYNTIQLTTFNTLLTELQHHPTSFDIQSSPTLYQLSYKIIQLTIFDSPVQHSTN